MAQESTVRQRSMPNVKYSFQNESVLVPEALTKLLDMNVAHCSRVFIQLTVAGQALDQFSISGAATPDAAAIIMFSAGADFTTPAGLVIDASGNLTTQAVGSGWVMLDVAGLDRLTVSCASGNVAGSTVSIYAGAV